MKNPLTKLDAKILRVVRTIGKEADRLNMNAYIVGGVVRDILLNRSVYDLDIVVEGDAHILAKRLAKLHKTKAVLHKPFMTATVRMTRNMPVDIVSARKETYKKPGALPTVKKGTLKDDLLRRDFTVNALAIQINKEDFGKIIDVCNGLNDLKKKKVRILHNKSFLDDPTRILRAVRFEQRLEFSMDRNTVTLLKRALAKKFERNVTPLRYFAEFKKLLSEKNADQALSRLKQLKGLGFIGSRIKPQMRTIKETHKRIEKIPNSVVKSDLLMLSLLENESIAVKKRVSAKFQLSSNLKKSLLQIASIKDIMGSLNRPSIPKSEIASLLRGLTDGTLAYLICRLKGAKSINRVEAYMKKDRYVMPSLKGEDLKELGISSGKHIGRLLDQLRNRKLDGKIRNKREEISELKKLAVSS